MQNVSNYSVQNEYIHIPDSHIFYPWIFVPTTYDFVTDWILIHVTLKICMYIFSLQFTWVYHVTLHVQLLLQSYLQCWLTFYSCQLLSKTVYTRCSLLSFSSTYKKKAFRVCGSEVGAKWVTSDILTNDLFLYF